MRHQPHTTIDYLSLTVPDTEDHYPERLGKAFINNVPYLATLFLKLIMPFVDPSKLAGACSVSRVPSLVYLVGTREKVHFNPFVVTELLYKPTEITASWGGDIKFIYEHEKYWPALLSLCQKRQAAETIRWQELGGVVGISEWDIKSTLKTENSAEVQADGLTEATHHVENAENVDR